MDFRPKANLSLFTRQVIEPQKKIKGFANADDALHFSMILGYLNQVGPAGNILEIGTYFGRSTMVLGWFVRPGEHLLVCDAFKHDTQDKYDDKPSVKDVLHAIRRATPDFDERSMIVHNGLSDSLKIPEAAEYRFAHVDGGHSVEEARADLELVAPHIVVGGVIAVDDYDHPRWPGVGEAADAFVADHPEFGTFADMNRWGALGRKLYLTRKL